MNRAANLEHLISASEPFDMLIVGGGATGLGAAVDAASRGHRVALLERADFAKGTSSRSTKLVHGGVRYLRQGNISLVLRAPGDAGAADTTTTGITLKWLVDHYGVLPPAAVTP